MWKILGQALCPHGRLACGVLMPCSDWGIGVGWGLYVLWFGPPLTSSPGHHGRGQGGYGCGPERQLRLGARCYRGAWDGEEHVVPSPSDIADESLVDEALRSSPATRCMF